MWDGVIQSKERAIEMINESNRQYLAFCEDPDLNKTRKYWMGNKH